MIKFADKMSKIKKNKKEELNFPEKIIVKGARTHNLKNISVEIPRNKLSVITGLSGSGKSSLAFDTIFAEGQRRYVESLSAYARQFLNQMQKPDVDEIIGLSPAISIDQKSRSNNPRSTVATITEIYDYMRVLYARIGKPHCLVCGQEISKLSLDEIVSFFEKKVSDAKKILSEKAKSQEILGVDAENSKIFLFSPVVKSRKGEYYQLLYDLLSKGYSKVRVDGEIFSLRDKIPLSKNKKHNIEVLIDEFYFSEFLAGGKDFRGALSESIEKAIDESEGLVLGVFSFEKKGLEKIFQKEKVDTEFLLSSKFSCPNDGFSYSEIEPRLFSFNSPVGACEACNGLGSRFFYGTEPCQTCNGNRLKPESLNVFLGKGKSKTSSIKDEKFYKSSGLNIVDVTSFSVSDALDFFDNLKLNKKEEEISKPIMREIKERLSFMLNVGIEYLTLNRKANTLSGGEAQRIRLASQLGSGLVGATYVLDEPTIGLHQRDNDRLIKTLLKMRDLGNTVIVVEHDEDVIYSADYLVDVGPKAGVLGGEIVASGFLEDLLTSSKNFSGSRTLAYLREEEVIEIKKNKRNHDMGKIIVSEGEIFNIKNLNVEIPLGKLVCITGVSGSGKSSFVHEILYKNLRARFDRKYRSAKVFNCKKIFGLEYISRQVLIDQSPIGRTPRSNPATYTGAFSHIRDLFAETTEAKIRGYKPGRFSFNVKGGRCEACSGNGYIAVEMHFLPTVYVKCDICFGKRFNKETLEVTYKSKNIAEVLDMEISKAAKFFTEIPAVYDRLKTLEDVGLGYLKLGQSANTLSGGEAQRVKISSELYRPFTEKTMYLLDEPTVGLHYDDVAKLNDILQKLVDRGNSVLVIEHNLDLIKTADYILDFGPEGGEKGGNIVAKGTPEDIAKNKNSLTGEYLKKTLEKTKRIKK